MKIDINEKIILITALREYKRKLEGFKSNQHWNDRINQVNEILKKLEQ